MTKPPSHIDKIVAEIAKQGALMDDATDAADRVSVSLPYPRIFRDLLESHSFAAFVLGDIHICGNIRGEDDSLDELLADKALTDALVNAGFLPFARPETGTYDRICFDMRGKTRPKDAPIVLMDHEAVLSHGRIPRPRQLAGSLIKLLEEHRQP
jgi:hypothetical protein